MTDRLPSIEDGPGAGSGAPLEWTAADGTPMALRRIGPADLEASRRFIRSLSYGTRYFRFGRGNFEYTDEELGRLCEPDFGEREHLVVLATREGTAEMAASARYVVAPDGEHCEFAIVVLDAWQHHGLGRLLLERLIESARRRGLKSMHCRILGTNARMIEFVRQMGFRSDEPGDGGSVKTVSMSLQRTG